MLVSGPFRFFRFSLWVWVSTFGASIAMVYVGMGSWICNWMERVWEWEEIVMVMIHVWMGRRGMRVYWVVENMRSNFSLYLVQR